MTRNRYDLENKVAIVTGGSRGIGRAIALGLAEAGADVVVASRKLENLELVARRIVGLGRRSIPVVIDMRNKEDIYNLVQTTHEEFGRIDIVVNDAASAFWGSVLDTEERTWDQMMKVNLKGPFLLSQAVAKLMIDQGGGSIINVASTGALRPQRGLGVYAVSKASLVMLTRVMALELSEHNIRVNAIAPGWTQTDFSKMGWSNPQTLKKVESKIPLGHWAHPDAMVGAVLFLASEDSSYITGHTIPVSGGTSI